MPQLPKSLIHLLTATTLMLLTGCAAPYYFNEPIGPVSAAKAVPELVGVWSTTTDVSATPGKKGVHITLLVYPLDAHSYLLENVQFSARHQIISCGVMRAWITTLGTQRFLTCQVFIPSLINQGENIAALKKQLAAAHNNSERLFTQSLINSSRRTGVAHLFFIVRIDSLTPTRLIVTPYMLSAHREPKDVLLSGRWFKSPEALAQFIQGVGGSIHAAKTPWIFARIPATATLPDGFYLGY
jgi:hypothetical protein